MVTGQGHVTGGQQARAGLVLFSISQLINKENKDEEKSQYLFVMPHEEQVTVGKFLETLETSPGKGNVSY